MSLSLPLFTILLLFSIHPPSAAKPPPQPHNFTAFSIADSPWRPDQNRRLLSPNSVFAAGFIPQPNNSNLFIFSVWDLTVPSHDVVWSANRISPVNRTAALVITPSGDLRLGNNSDQNLWPSQNVSGNPNSTELILRDDGNLIFASWESFRFPTNTILPNQSLNLTSIASNNGKYVFMNAVNLTYSTEVFWSAGNSFQMLGNDGQMLKANQDSFITSDFNSSRRRRLVLDDDGNLRIYSFDPNPRRRRWSVVWQAVQELCRIYATCGPNSICMSSSSLNSSYCICPPGFRPESPEGARQGCRRKIELSEKIKFMSLDSVVYRGLGREMSLEVQNITACENGCRRNGSCVGYSFSFDGGAGCLLHLDILSNGFWSPGMKRATFLKVDEAETDTSNFTGLTYKLQTTCRIHLRLQSPEKTRDTTTRDVLIICVIFAGELVSGAIFFRAFLKRFMKYRDMARTLGLESLPAGGPKRFTFAELKTATKDFSIPIGRGGYGEVFKGELPDKRIIAVKCLKHVHGGDGDFWAEVTIIARMHHLNLLRLWGFCAEKGRRMLVYEYIPNGSLDKYLFTTSITESPESEINEPLTDPDPALDWSIRYRIAIGVARAIAYLHEEVSEWVLHRDIKPENILLDDDFCPKLSDFGLSKLQKKEDTTVSMSRIRGTPGYVAPELVRIGSSSITTKADVYSYGMVLLEIISGIRNVQFRRSTVESADWYFPSWAFDKVFVEEKIEDILDGRIKHQYDSGAHFAMVNRMVQTAMWCLEDEPEMRPAMGKVVKMLEGKVEIAQPEKPTVFFLADQSE